MNCAHDSPEAWAAILANLRSAEKKGAPRQYPQTRFLQPPPDAGPPERNLTPISPPPIAVGRAAKVSFDLAGPKLRTESIEGGAAVSQLSALLPRPANASHHLPGLFGARFEGRAVSTPAFGHRR